MPAAAPVLLWTILVLGSAVMISVLVWRAKGGREQGASGSPATGAGDRNGARAERLRNLLLSRMSHDLRSPLNSIITLSQLLIEGNAGPLSIDQRRYAEVIRHSGQSLLALVNDILDLAAVESGRVELELELVDVSAVVEAVGRAAASTSRDRGVPLHVRAPDRRLLARTDEEHLRLVMQRLVEHAISETHNGYVEVTALASADRRRALLRVHETEPGLSEGERRALSTDADELDDYVAGEKDFTTRGPTALPLVVAARMARLMGLHVGVDSDGGNGVTFELSLPIAVEEGRQSPAGDQPDDPASVPPEVALAGGTLPRGSGQVLLIEDDPLERQRVALVLEAAGYRVRQAGSGDEGLSLLRDGVFDAVVLDLVMPGMSGLDVLRAARAEERLADVPFVVLSALYMTKSERAVLGPNVRGVVRKGDTTGEALAQSLRRAIKIPPGDARSATGSHGGPHA